VGIKKEKRNIASVIIVVAYGLPAPNAIGEAMDLILINVLAVGRQRNLTVPGVLSEP